MTTNKQDLLTVLRATFETWERFLAGRTEEQLTARRRPDEWSTSDVVAHLMAWQQLSIARLEAAQRDGEPVYPAWLGGADPFFAEDHVNQFNARIHDIYRDEPWSAVHRAWRDGFASLLALAETIPEGQLLEPGRYHWLKGHPLAAVLQGWFEHHEEHFESVSRRLQSGGN